MTKLTLLSIFVIGYMFLTGCFSEEIDNRATTALDANKQTTFAKTVSQGETSEVLDVSANNYSLASKDKEPQITQARTENASELVRAAHHREGLKPLYQSAWPESLALPKVSFQVFEPQLLIEALDGDFKLMNNQTRIYQDEEGAILGSNNEYSLNYRHPRCDKQLNTIHLHNAYSLSNRRVKTLSTSDEFSFMSRQAAVDYSQELF